MDSLLQDVSAAVRKQIDEMSHLLDFLHLLPITDKLVLPISSSCDDNFNDSDCNAATINSKEEEVEIEEEQEGCQVFRKFTELYDRIRSLESQQVEQQPLSEKSKNLLASLVVDALTLISKSPALQRVLKQLLNHNNHASGNGKADNDDDGNKNLTSNAADVPNEISLLQEFLGTVRDVGCQKIEISAEKEKDSSTALFKLIDKCTHKLEPEKNALQKAIAYKDKELQDERKFLEDTLQKNKQEIQAIERKTMEEYHALRQKVNTEMCVEKDRHEREMSSLQSEIEDIQSRLAKESHDHILEQQDLIQCCKAVETKILAMEQEHAAEVERKVKEIERLKSLLETEQSDLKELEKKWSAIEANQRIEEEERRLLEIVADMESKADAILYNGAVALQKIIRGTQARALAKKLMAAMQKKKAKKNNKKKKSASKSKKNTKKQSNTTTTKPRKTS